MSPSAPYLMFRMKKTTLIYGAILSGRKSNASGDK